MTTSTSGYHQHLSTTTINKTAVSVPPGLSCILGVCQRLYPAQPNPLQASPAVKFWLGGPDPLDYISMYLNAGSEIRGIPEHWHYITFGLSDIYGDGRVHPVNNPEECGIPSSGQRERESGFGFELTFRLKRAAGELTAPLWPAKFLQDLARYIFSTNNTFQPGDHVSWRRPLDGKESRIQDVIMAADPQLATVSSVLGQVEFVQVVGVCKEELEAAQHWNGRGVLELLRSCKTACGPLWITDIRRNLSIFEMDPQLGHSVQEGIDKDGSDLSGVSCCCRWVEIKPNKNSRSTRSISLSDTNQIRAALQDRLSDGGTNEVAQVRYLDTVHLSFNQEAGSLLGLALCGRLLHGRHFTFRSVQTDDAITFVSADVQGTSVSRQRPLAVAGSWLQIYLTEADILEISEDVRVLTVLEKILPYRLFSWPNLRLNVTVAKDETLFAI